MDPAYIIQARELIRSSTKAELEHILLETEHGRKAVEAMALGIMADGGKLTPCKPP